MGFCHQCGKETLPGSKFCASCGTPIQAASVGAPTVADPIAPTPVSSNQSVIPAEISGPITADLKDFRSPGEIARAKAEAAGRSDAWEEYLPVEKDAERPTTPPQFQEEATIPASLPRALLIVNRAYLVLFGVAFLGTLRNGGGSPIYLLLAIACGLVAVSPKYSGKNMYISALVMNAVTGVLLLARVLTLTPQRNIEYWGILFVSVIFYLPIFVNIYYIFANLRPRSSQRLGAGASG